MSVRRYALLALATIAAGSCKPPPPAPLATVTRGELPPAPDGVVRFRGRDIDLRPYVEEFPYLGLTPQAVEGKLVYLRDGARRTAWTMPLGDNMNLDDGEPFSDADLGDYQLDQLTLHGETLYFRDAFESARRLHRLRPDGTPPERLTREGDVTSWQLDRERDRIVFIEQIDSTPRPQWCLRSIELGTSERRDVYCADRGPRFGSLSLRPDGTGAVVSLFERDERHDLLPRTALGYVALDVPEPALERLTGEEHVSVQPLSSWLDVDRLLYRADGAVRQFDLATTSSSEVARLDALQEPRLLRVDDRPVLLTLSRPAHPAGDGRTPGHVALAARDPESGAVLAERELPGHASFLDAAADVAYLYRRAPGGWSVSIGALELVATKPKPTPVLTVAVELPVRLRRRLSTCRTVPMSRSVALLPRHAPSNRPIVLLDYSRAGFREASLLCAAGISILPTSARLHGDGLVEELKGVLGVDDLVVVARWRSDEKPQHPPASISKVIEREAQSSSTWHDYGIVGDDRVPSTFVPRSTWPETTRTTSERLVLRPAARVGSRLEHVQLAVSDLFALVEDRTPGEASSASTMRAATPTPTPSAPRRRSTADDY